MLENVANIFRIPELRRRIIVTVLLLFVCRAGVFVPVPGVDTKVLKEWFTTVEQRDEGSLVGMVDLFAGGALQNCAIFGLGVMPYISASIIFQLLGSVIPALERLQKEGEAGRRKLNQYTRYATVCLCLVQAAMLLGALHSQNADIFHRGFGFGSRMVAALVMTAGTMFLMWIGEQVDEHGIGNGISLIIMINIIGRLPVSLAKVFKQMSFTLNAEPGEIGIGKVAVMGAFFVLVVIGIIFVTRGQRRIPFQQAKQMRGRRVYGGMKHYLPLQVNAAGVIPVIFASSLLMFPGIIFGWMVRSTEGTESLMRSFALLCRDSLQPGAFIYTLSYVLLIFFFCYFWTAIQFNPQDMASNLKDHGSFIPGIRPGRRTAEYLERVMTRITLPGAAFLALIAVMPTMVALALGGMNSPLSRVASFYGGTSLLIVVGVALDLVRKIESHLLMRHYDGLTKATRRRR